MPLELPESEFRILKQDETEIRIYDLIVERIYVYHVAEKRWVFPTGSRFEAIERLTGLNLG